MLSYDIFSINFLFSQARRVQYQTCQFPDCVAAAAVLQTSVSWTPSRTNITVPRLTRSHPTPGRKTAAGIGRVCPKPRRVVVCQPSTMGDSSPVRGSVCLGHPSGQAALWMLAGHVIVRPRLRHGRCASNHSQTFQRYAPLHYDSYSVCAATWRCFATKCMLLGKRTCMRVF